MCTIAWVSVYIFVVLMYLLLYQSVMVIYHIWKNVTFICTVCSLLLTYSFEICLYVLKHIYPCRHFGNIFSRHWDINYAIWLYGWGFGIQTTIYLNFYDPSVQGIQGALSVNKSPTGILIYPMPFCINHSPLCSSQKLCH